MGFIVVALRPIEHQPENGLPGARRRLFGRALPEQSGIEAVLCVATHGIAQSHRPGLGSARQGGERGRLRQAVVVRPEAARDEAPAFVAEASAQAQVAPGEGARARCVEIGTVGRQTGRQGEIQPRIRRLPMPRLGVEARARQSFGRSDPNEAGVVGRLVKRRRGMPGAQVIDRTQFARVPRLRQTGTRNGDGFLAEEPHGLRQAGAVDAVPAHQAEIGRRQQTIGRRIGRRKCGKRRHEQHAPQKTPENPHLTLSRPDPHTMRPRGTRTYSTVTDFARLRGLSTSVPRTKAT